MAVIARNEQLRPALLTVREVATALRASEETIRRRVHDGTLAAIKFGGLTRIPASELERVLGETEVEPERSK